MGHYDHAITENDRNQWKSMKVKRHPNRGLQFYLSFNFKRLIGTDFDWFYWLSRSIRASDVT